MLIAADSTPSLAHIAPAIPKTAARADAARVFEHIVVGPSVHALPPIHHGIAGHLRTIAPEALVENVFEELRAIGPEQIHPGVSTIYQRGACRQIFAPDGADSTVAVAPLNCGKLRDGNRDAGYLPLALGRVLEKFRDVLLPPVHHRKILRAHDVVLTNRRARQSGRERESPHLIAVTKPAVRSPHPQRLPILN